MPDAVNKIFKAVADPTRRKIFNVLVLASTALSINQISDHFDISRQGVSKHIKLLQEAGLVRMKTQGRERFCYANPKPLKKVRNWVAHYEQFWDQKLRMLQKHLDKKA